MGCCNSKESVLPSSGGLPGGFDGTKIAELGEAAANIGKAVVEATPDLG